MVSAGTDLTPALLLAEMNYLDIETLRVNSVRDHLLGIDTHGASRVIKNGFCLHLLLPSFLS